MSQDGQEADTSRQRQQQASDAQPGRSGQPDQLPFPQDQQQAQLATDDDNEPPLRSADSSSVPEDEQVEEEAQEARAISTTPRLAFTRLFGQYFSLILIPLLFGIVTCIIILPLLATGHAHLPYAAFWPVTLVIFAIAIAQGLALYYSGDNTSLWVVSNVGAFFLFLLVVTFSIFGLVPGIVLFIVLLIISIVLIRLYIMPVPEGFVNIVFAFGRYSRTLDAGFNILLPWEKVVRELSITETAWNCPPQRIQMSHTEDVVLRSTISYQLRPEEEHLAVTQVKDWEESLRNVCIAAIQTIATTFSPNDLIVWQQGLHSRPDASADMVAPPESRARWEKINTYLFEHIQDRVDPWGIQINWVRIHDIVLTPHAAPVLGESIVAGTDGNTVAMPPEAVAQQVRQAAPLQPDPVAAGPRAEQVRAQPQASQQAPRARAFVLPKTLKDEDLEKVLARAYKEVREERITDPETIRSIADTFVAIARDPEKSRLVSFDLDRAIRNLLTQAERCEELYAASGVYSDDTRPDWPIRHPSDDNLMAGG